MRILVVLSLISSQVQTLFVIKILAISIAHLSLVSNEANSVPTVLRKGLSERAPRTLNMIALSFTSNKVKYEQRVHTAIQCLQWRWVLCIPFLLYGGVRRPKFLR